MADLYIKQDDIDGTLSEEAKGVMLHLILSWAQFDNVLTHFLLFAFGVSVDEGSVLLGPMDTRSKIDKLKALYLHHGMQKRSRGSWKPVRTSQALRRRSERDSASHLPRNLSPKSQQHRVHERAYQQGKEGAV